MHFKKLEVFGFKSFADKLNLEFEDGITAIVGPNGCGKSNVADSIRWALGEQSAKSLRGSQMQDVIFSGTDARKSLSFCEVSLHFDNTERIFESEFNDVVISRKLYRSGDSEYMINKNAVRYKDIGAILHNTGLGKNSYSIIGQGRIDSILSAKPGDRRGIFEDAAGISKYKEAKIENERKLARVAEKLDRSGDIIAELEKQLDPLRKQAEDARRCFEVQEKLKYYDVNNYIVQYESVQDKRDEINLRLQAIDEEYDLKQDEYNAASDEYQAIMDGFDSLDVEMSKLNDERLELNLSLEKQASEIKILKEKINHLKEQNDRMRGEVAKFNGEYEEDNRKLAGLSASRIDKSALADTLKIDIDGVSTRYLEVVQILARNEDEVERAHREVITSMSRLSEAKSELSRLSAEKDSVAERLEDYDRRIDVILNKISEDQKKAERIKADVDTFFAGRQKAFDAGAQKAALYERTNQQIRELALDIDKLSAEYHSKQSRAKLLDELHKEMQGYSYSVKAVLKEASVNKKIAACVEGVLAQLIKVKAEHETAIEMVLGGALQNIITNTEEDAKFIIEFLKQNRFGRATFLPISSVKSRVLDQGSAKYLSIRGVIGVASELIEYDRKYKDIIENLLGRTVVVDTMDTAIYVARESKYAFRIVTLDGDIISPQGSITGGSKKSEISNLLSQERELEAAQADVARIEKALAGLNAKRAAEAAAAEKIQAELKKLNDTVYGFDIKIAAEREKLQEVTTVIEEAGVEASATREEKAAYSGRGADIEREIEECNRLENTISGQNQETGEFNEKNQKQFEELKAERVKLGDELTALKVKQAGNDSELVSENAEMLRLKNEIVELLAAVEENNADIDRNEKVIAAADLSVVREGGQIDRESAERLTDVVAALAGLSARKQEIQTGLLRVDKEKSQIQAGLNELAERKFVWRNELVKIDSAMQYHHEKITEEYKMTYDDCLLIKDTDYNYNKGVAEANRLKRELMRFGPINANAVEDYARIKERYDSESLQKADLDKSIEDIRKIIKEMTHEMLTRFSTQFELIRVNFSRVFKELFAGGRADLILEEAEDPLEAGIEIVAEPPGKKLQSISLLSGGERALTAIAILFAILNLKPMPFCILDEIEAALDDANAERFAKYLHKFSAKTQFIVITHRKPTMELADSLYGVTMEEKGISKIVSVKLSDAVKNIG